MRKITHLIIHHSATEDSGLLSWLAIRKFHTDPPPAGRGWADCGYNYGLEKIEDRYVILKGRLDHVPGAHSTGYNSISLGICCVGNFDKVGMPRDQEFMLLDLCRSLMMIYGIQPENILGHRETYVKQGVPVQKSCPGNMVSMDRLRALLT